MCPHYRAPAAHGACGGNDELCDARAGGFWKEGGSRITPIKISPSLHFRPSKWKKQRMGRTAPPLGPARHLAALLAVAAASLSLARAIAISSSDHGTQALVVGPQSPPARAAGDEAATPGEGDNSRRLAAVSLAGNNTALVVRLVFRSSAQALVQPACSTACVDVRVQAVQCPSHARSG